MSASYAYCPQCSCESRVSEENAFGGRDKLRRSLSCGHVVVKVASGDPVVKPGLGPVHTNTREEDIEFSKRLFG